MKNLLKFVIIMTLLSLSVFAFADTEVEPNDTYNATGVFTVVNGTHDGTIDPGEDMDYFAFAASINDAVVVSTLGLADFDTKLWIYDMDGVTELALNDDAGGTLQSEVTLTIPLSGTYYFVVGSYSTNVGPYGVSLAGANTPTYLDNDLMATGITGNPTPTMGAVSTCSVFMMNIGNNEATNFTVELFDGADVNIGSTDVASLAAGEMTTIDVDWTPVTVGMGTIYAVLNFAADEDTDNNQTDDFGVDVQSSGTVVVTIGEGTESTYFVPACYFYKNSVSEQIYYAEELQVGGVLMAIDFFYNFVDVPVVSDLNVWIGETTLTDLSGGFIPSTELTSIYSGPFDYAIGVDGFIHIPLATPYAYGGGNLVVLVQRPMDTEYYSSSDKFYNSVDAVNAARTIYKYSDTIDYDPAVPPTDGITTGIYANAAFYFITENMGAITGTVTSEGAPLADASVVIDGTAAMAMTDADGVYNFPYVMEGDVTLTASKFGFYDGTASATVVEDETSIADMTIDPLPSVMVSGNIFGSDYPAVGLADATVSLSGYESYEGMTDANGHFEITGVFSNQTYDIAVSVAGYDNYTSTVEVAAADVVVPDITVLEVVSPASNVVATPNTEYTSVEVTWEAPTGATETEFRYDDGVVTSQLGFNGSPNSVMGAAHFYDATVTEVTWLLTSNAAHTEAIIYIFGLDAAGMPDTNDLLHDSGILPNVDDVWNTYTLPTPVEAPNGFYVGVNTLAVFTALGMDDGIDEPYAFQEGTQLGVADWTLGTNDWLDVGPAGFPFNFTIRAMGANNGAIEYTRTAQATNADADFTYSELRRSIDAGAPVYNTVTTTSRMVETYDVYRLLAADQGTPAEWDLLAEDLTDMSYTDATFAEVLAGEYQYAVVAMFTNDVAAPAAFSNVIANGVMGTVTFEITTNDAVSAEGAEITFTASDGAPEHVYTAVAAADGTVMIENVWFETYTLEVSLGSHDNYVENNIVFDDDATITAELEESLNSIGSLTAEVDGSDVTLSWGGASGMFEGFEGAYPPEGWAKINPDGGTGWEPLIVGTTPLPGWTGGEATACPDGGTTQAYCTYTTGGAASNDQWLVTPMIGVTSNTVLDFWLGYYFDTYTDYLEILISTTDQNDPAAFTTVVAEITPSVLGWENLTYNLSDFVAPGTGVYIAFRETVADNQGDGSAISIDNVMIGAPATRDISVVEFAKTNEIGVRDENYVSIATTTVNSTREILSYTVKRDGEVIATDVTETTYVDVDVPVGDYTYSVAIVYTTGTSDYVDVDVTVGEDDADEITPITTTMNGNYPNPFNPTTTISYDLATAGNVNIAVYNIKGQLVKVLVNENQAAASHTVVWDGQDSNSKSVASGVYFYKMNTASYKSINKMILMK